MRVILSRKGFDSANGRIPSPIMPDGTLLSLPIPNDVNDYEILEYKGKSYSEIIYELSNGKEQYIKCHYDPDIREDAIKEKFRPKNWLPAFGQVDAALTHLQNQNVQVGDLFLFFGLFRECEIKNGKYQYVRGSQAKHIIWGYLQIAEILYNPTSKTYPWLVEEGKNKHPHFDRDKKNNALFIGSKTLSWDKTKKGAGCLTYKKERVLTKEGFSKSRWDLPDFFKEIEISYHKNDNWKDNYFQSADIGQEFVFFTNERIDVMKWVSNMIDAEPPRNKDTKETPDNITELRYDEIFVFGSDEVGSHKNKLAKQALQWGAVIGEREGLFGKTYAIPMQFNTVEEISPYIKTFIDFAVANPYKRFLVTKIGDELTNLSDFDFGLLFSDVLQENISNICLPLDYYFSALVIAGAGKD